MALETPRRSSRTIHQGRESRLWCMLVVEQLERGASLREAVDAAAELVEDEATANGNTARAGGRQEA